MDKAKRTSGSGQVVIRLDQRLFYGIVAVLGVLAVFFVGLWLGRATLGSPGRSQAALPQQPLGQQAVPMQPGAEQAVPPWQGETQAQMKATWPAGDSMPIGDNPRLALPELKEVNYTYDFGDIAPDQIVEKTFKVVNQGPKDLVIEDVSSSCGCTAALLSEDTIPPGGEAELRVTYDPRVNKDTGFIQRKVRIKSNDPAAPLVEFTVAANVLAE
ncbi:MAG: DUF1573 domain-containing protein [Anaerolineae bacterium]